MAASDLPAFDWTSEKKRQAPRVPLVGELLDHLLPPGLGLVEVVDLLENDDELLVREGVGRSADQPSVEVGELLVSLSLDRDALEDRQSFVGVEGRRLAGEHLQADVQQFVSVLRVGDELLDLGLDGIKLPESSRDLGEELEQFLGLVLLEQLGEEFVEFFGIALLGQKGVEDLLGLQRLAREVVTLGQGVLER